jgi:hypothetical protein
MMAKTHDSSWERRLRREVIVLGFVLFFFWAKIRKTDGKSFCENYKKFVAGYLMFLSLKMTGIAVTDTALPGLVAESKRPILA